MFIFLYYSPVSLARYLLQNQKNIISNTPLLHHSITDLFKMRLFFYFSIPSLHFAEPINDAVGAD